MPNDNTTHLPKAWNAFLEQQSFLPVIVKSIERIHDSTWSMLPNSHSHFELVYMKRGRSVFTVDGEDVRLEPDNMIIIKPHKTHKLSVKKGGKCEFIVLSFAFEDRRGGGISDVSLDDFIEFVNTDSAGSFIHFSLSHRNSIVSVLENIIRERGKELVWGSLMTHLLLMELFVLISRALKNEWELSIQNRSVKTKEVLRAAKAYIDENYSRDLSPSDVARYVFLSESYFTHMFKAEFGISPKSYMLKVRIDASKRLLAQSDMRVRDIALEVGFSSPQRYNDVFRKNTGMTPLEYRRIQKINILNKNL